LTVAIIGAGFAGLAAADALIASGVEVDVFDAQHHWGGHAYSLEQDGFTFDEGPHVSFTTDPRVKELFAHGAGQVEHLAARITNYFGGHWLEHPAQCHLHGLDPQLITRCIADIAREHVRPRAVDTYADWCRASFGDTFAEQFPFAYTRKYWTVEAHRLTTDWVKSRMYPPKLEEVIRGALQPQQPGDFHYVSECRYPNRGGYQAFASGLVHQDALRLGRRVVGVDLDGLNLRFADGTTHEFERLISTMPLPALIECVDQAPDEVRRAADELLCTSVVLVDVAINRPDISAHHWLYVYDEDISFSRVSFPHMLSPNNAPEACGAIQVEVYHSRHRALPCAVESLPGRVIEELVRIGLLASPDEVLWARHREVPYGNVVFDRQRSAALETILPWMHIAGVVLAGRYGEWGYHWTDDAVRSGRQAAARILDSMG
jgi:protoporphyrinogen oxidase